MCTILERLSMIEDSRRGWGNFRHPLDEILFIALCAIIAGLTGFEEMSLFGQQRQEWFKKYLPLKNGIPSESTFERVFAALKPTELEKFYQSWALSLRQEGNGKHLSIDGKTICGASSAAQKVHMVSAWLSESGLCLGQLRTNEKSNEITTIPELLDMLDISGCVVTIDAMGCQKEIAKKICSKKGDYILAVKENQPTLLSDIRQYFRWLDEEHPPDIPYDRCKASLEKGHGRIERRSVEVCKIENWPDMSKAWKNVGSIVRYDCERIIGEEVSRSTRYYISSLSDCSAEKMLGYLRSHWSIENQLHWMLDVTMKEDSCQVRKNNAAENLNRIRKMALSLLRKTPTAKKLSAKSKTFLAVSDMTFLELVLFGS